MQLSWATGIGWDDPISEYKQELNSINKLTIPRRITLDGHPIYELPSFSDSSKKECTVWVVQCYLILAKSKLAPLKRVTIPRLELSGALLTIKLLHLAYTILTPISKIESIEAWTDSIIVLAWIKSSTHRWMTFSVNRTSQIHTIIYLEIYSNIWQSCGLYPIRTVPLWVTSAPSLVDWSFLSQDTLHMMATNEK